MIMLANHTFVLDVLIVVYFNFGISKKSHRLTWTYRNFLLYLNISIDLIAILSARKAKSRAGWYTFRPKVLSETYIFFYTFRPVAECIYIRFGQSKFLFLLSAKSCYLCFSDKLINCTFRPKIIKYTFRPKFVSLFTSFFTRGREKAGVYSYWHCSLTDVWQSEIAHILHHRKQSISLIANRVILF